MRNYDEYSESLVFVKHKVMFFMQSNYNIFFNRQSKSPKT